MKSRKQIFEKFGVTAEAAQLLETEIGNLLLENEANEQDLFKNLDHLKAQDILNKINRSTLGQLIKKLSVNKAFEQEMLTVLSNALESRNRLLHSFFREHNFRINTDEGRVLMFEDLDKIHTEILLAYKNMFLIQGIDLDNLSFNLPTKHLKL